MKLAEVSESFSIYQADVLEGLAALADESIHCVVTSPPYWALRDYGTGKWEGGDSACDHLQKVGGTNSSTLGAASGGNDMSANAREQSIARSFVPYLSECKKCGAIRIDKQLGLESTPEEYVKNMVDVFREVKRVLRNDGTLWLNIGDTYAANRSYQVQDNKHADVGNHMPAKVPEGLKAKDLIGIPWMLAFALRADGWYLRSDIIWHKPNPMPSSVMDRPTTNHEYLFLLTKSARYFYDKIAIAEPAQWDRWGSQTTPKHNGTKTRIGWIKSKSKRELMEQLPKTRNKRTVWTIPTQPYKGSHYATFPEALAEPCILAGTSAHGCCEDCGSPYRRLVEKKFYGDIRSTDRAKDLQHGAKNPNGQKAWDEYVAPQTIGWEPTCDCEDAQIVPCTVLDPFLGSGTTAQVCRSLGRNAVGIDLDERNIEQATKRFFSATRKERAAKTVKKVKKPRVGQLSLLEEK